MHAPRRFGMLVVLFAAYRRVGALVLSALPLASAAVAGLAAVSAVFGTVHGITLAFGFTLLGVAQDYPLHLLSHRRPGVAPADVARKLWPPLATGIASTSIAYLTFWFSGVTGLQQLACFTVTGLAVAGATTRWLLPPMMSAGDRDYGDSAPLVAHRERDRSAAATALGATLADRCLRRRRRARSAAVLGERPQRSDTRAARSVGTRSKRARRAWHRGYAPPARRRSTDRRRSLGPARGSGCGPRAARALGRDRSVRSRGALRAVGRRATRAASRAAERSGTTIRARRRARSARRFGPMRSHRSSPTSSAHAARRR